MYLDEKKSAPTTPRNAKKTTHKVDDKSKKPNKGKEKPNSKKNGKAADNRGESRLT